MSNKIPEKQIIDSLQHGIIVIDTNDEIILLNKAVENMSGISASEAIGKGYHDVIKERVFAGNRDKKVRHEGKTEYCSYLLTNRKEAKEIPIRHYIQPLENPPGNVIGRIEILSEISDVVRLEDALRVSEMKYKGLFEDSKDMIFTTDKRGRIMEVNQACAETLGYRTKEEILTIASVEKIYDNPLHWKVFQNQIDLHGFVKEFDSIFKKKDGDKVHCFISGHALRGEDEEILGYEAIAKDITARMDAIRNFRQRHREMRVLNSVALAMNKTQDLNDILSVALKKTLEALEIRSGGIFLVDIRKGAFSLRAEQGLLEEGQSLDYTISLNDKGLMEALLRPDLRLEPEPIFPPFKAVFESGDNRPVELTCFLITAKEKASGFLAFAVQSDKDITIGQDFHLIGSLGNFLGGAIENRGLVSTVQQHREELKRLTAQLFHSQDNERKRIARELHDESGQALIGINLTLETLEKQISDEAGPILEPLLDIKRQINRTYQEIRRISYSLHPALLSEIGLAPALESYCEQLSRQSEIDIEYKIVGFESRIDPTIEIALYRITQEVLSNTIKHSNARHFRLSIVKSFPNIIFSAEDDGVGFNTDQVMSREKSLGLLGMRERVSMLGGRLSISSPKGKGVRIKIELPVREHSNG